MSKLQKWVFMIQAEDRPGVTTSIATIFSGRGFQIETIMGYGHEASQKNSEALMIVVFEALESRKDIMLKLTERLELIQSVRAYAYDSPQLLKSITVKIKKSAIADFNLQEISQSEEFAVCQAQGVCVEMDELLDELEENGCLDSHAYHIFALN